MKTFTKFLMLIYFVFISNFAIGETEIEVFDVKEEEVINQNISYPQKAELVFSELMVSPLIGPEWIEIYNPTGEAKKLTGCGLKDLGVTHHSYVIKDKEIIIEPYGYILLSGGFFPSQCKMQSDYQYKSISLVDNGIEEIVLACPGSAKEGDETIIFDDIEMIVIDKVVFDFSDMKIQKGYSMTLCPNFLSAEENDNLNNWAGGETLYCEVLGKKEYGTPLKENTCPPKPPEKKYATEGELVITEIMISPSKGSEEWFEIYNPTIKTFDLNGCKIEEGKTTVHSDEIESENPIRIGPKEYFLLSSIDKICPTCPLVDYKYSEKLSFNENEEEFLKILCPQKDGMPANVVIDEILFNKNNKSSVKDGYSWSLNPEKIDATLNDTSENWCQASDETFYMIDEINKNYGTPKSQNQCPPPPIPPLYPLEGEVIITEIMIAPDGGAPEWFEIYNLTEKEFDLWGCKIEEGTKIKKNEHIISLESKLKILKKSYKVLAKKYCIEGDVCNITSYVYSTLTFNNSEEEELSLYCPDSTGKNLILIDKVKYNWKGKEKGVSNSLKNEKFNSKDNDLKENWCDANKADVYPSIVEVPNYGTPGSQNRCAGEVIVVEKECVEPPCAPEVTEGKGCFCEISERKSNGQFFTFFAIFILFISFCFYLKRSLV